MNKMIIINSPFSIEASPPSLNADVYNIRLNLESICDMVDVLDLDSICFMHLKGDYDLIYYLLGGYPFSYPTNSFVPLNVYPFETLPTGPLILDILMGISVNENLKLICKQLSLDYKTTLYKFENFLAFLHGQVNILAKYEKIVFISDSIVSCIMSYYLSKKGDFQHIYGVGKNYFLPLLNDMLASYKQFDKLFTDKYDLFFYFDLKNPNKNNFDFKDVSMENYEFGYGIGHVLLKCGNGCPNKCTFCSIRLSWNNNEVHDVYYEESNDIISDKIDNIYDNFGITFIHIGVCTFNSNIKKATALLKILKNKKALFSTSLTVKNLSNEFIQYMNNSHFYKVIIGVESMNNAMLSIMNKGKNTNYDLYKSDVLRIKKEFEKNNIISQMNILLFYPRQSKENIINVINDWKKLFDELYINDITTDSIPIGTLCLNYPSQMYKDVMTDSDFDIIYHIPTKKQKENKEYSALLQYYEKIPFYAVYGNNISADNKLDYVNMLKKLENVNLELETTNLLNQIYPVAEEISSTWLLLGKKIMLNNNSIDKFNLKEIKWLKCKKINNMNYADILKHIGSEYERQLVLLLVCLIHNNGCKVK